MPAATVLGTRLIVRRGGDTKAAKMVASDSDDLVHASPSFRFHTQLSGDGHFLFIRPEGLLKPGPGTGSGSPATGRRRRTRASSTRRSASAPRPPGGGCRWPWASNRVGALTISRLALPLPALLPSVNQIGFDSYDLIAGTLKKTRPNRSGVGRILMWVVGARRAGGQTLADPHGNFAFPLEGTYRGDQVMLNASKVDMQFSFGPVPLRSLDFRGRLGADGRFGPGASLYGQVTCAEVPNYSVYLYVAGVCNPSDTLAASGTFLSDRYRGGPANRRPAGLSVSRLRLRRPTASSAGEAKATLRARPRRQLPRPPPPRLDPPRRRGNRQAGQPRLPHPDQQRWGTERQPPPDRAGDPGRDGSCRPGSAPTRSPTSSRSARASSRRPGSEQRLLAGARLELEQRALRREAAGVAGQRAVGADHPVAGDDDRQRVAAGRGADGAGPVGAPQRPGDRPVALRLAVGDRGDLLPDRPLEAAAAARRQRQLELAPLAGEVLLELGRGLGEGRLVIDPIVALRRWRPGSCTALSASPSPIRRSSPSGVWVVVV